MMRGYSFEKKFHFWQKWLVINIMIMANVTEPFCHHFTVYTYVFHVDYINYNTIS